MSLRVVLRTILKESDDMFCNYDQYKDKEVVKKHEQLLKQLGEKRQSIFAGMERRKHHTGGMLRLLFRT